MNKLVQCCPREICSSGNQQLSLSCQSPDANPATINLNVLH